eukprot:g39142.t1
MQVNSTSYSVRSEDLIAAGSAQIFLATTAKCGDFDRDFSEGPQSADASCSLLHVLGDAFAVCCCSCFGTRGRRNGMDLTRIVIFQISPTGDSSAIFLPRGDGLEMD